MWKKTRDTRGSLRCIHLHHENWFFSRADPWFEFMGGGALVELNAVQSKAKNIIGWNLWWNSFSYRFSGRGVRPVRQSLDPRRSSTCHSLPHLYPGLDFLWATRRVFVEKQTTLTLPGHLVHASFFSGVRVAHLLLLLCRVCLFFMFGLCPWILLISARILVPLVTL